MISRLYQENREFLCSFLQTTEIDVFDHLCAIYLNDRDLSNCDAILPLLEYHTFVNHKRHYIQNQFFCDDDVPGQKGAPSSRN